MKFKIGHKVEYFLETGRGVGLVCGFMKYNEDVALLASEEYLGMPIHSRHLKLIGAEWDTAMVLRGRYLARFPGTLLDATMDSRFIRRVPQWCYIVRPGDTLSEISEDLLGSASRFTELWAINQKHLRGTCASEIYPGEVIVLP